LYKYLCGGILVFVLKRACRYIRIVVSGVVAGFETTKVLRQRFETDGGFEAG
jgi:hypothetical protein